MKMMKMIAYITLSFFTFTFSVFADDVATQTDWSGGDGVTGPVTDWEDTFDESSNISLLIFPGELQLSSTLDIPIEHIVDDSFANAICVHAVDIDSDGDMDVLGAANYDDDVTWWENNGSGGGWTEHSIDNDFDGAISIYSVDLDDDGDMDVLGAAFDGNEITWWENNGSGGGWNEHIIDGSFNGASSVYSADMDGDGDMDVLGAAFYDDDIAWWANNGSGGGWIETTIDDSFGKVASINAVDVDGDGDMDVLGAAFDDNEITWWENNGSGGGWIEHLIEDNFDYAVSVYAADIDGDGDMDVLGAANDENDIIWWENNGSGGGWNKHPIDSDFDGAWSVYSVDIDSDGDMDVLGTAIDADDVTWWENDGSGNGWIEYLIDGDFDSARSVYSADLDGDGDMDVLGASWYDNCISWWEVIEFNSSGDLTSSIYDTEVDTGMMDLEWGPITWIDDVPVDSTVTVEVRASNDSGNMGDWTAIVSSGDNLTNYIDDDTRYFQYKVLMTTTDINITPTFEDITIEWEEVTGISDDEGNLPIAFNLRSVTPNPSSGTATIGYALPKTCDVELSLYDIKGRKLATLVYGTHQPGEYSTNVNGLASGVYIYELKADEFVSSKKMVVK